MQFDVSKHCSQPFISREFKDNCFSVIGEEAIYRQRKETTTGDIVASQNTDIATAEELAVICDPANLKV